MHVLPTGFPKVRHYGFMSPNSSVTINQIRELVKEAKDIVNDESSMQLTEPELLLCPKCAVPLRYVFSLIYNQAPPAIGHNRTG